MLIEGKNAVSEALNGDVTIEKLCVQKGLFNDGVSKLVNLAKAKKLKVVFSEKDVMDMMSESKRHQGIIAVATEYKYSELDEILQRKDDKPLFVIILDGIEDPHNLGAIIRVADCVGANGIILPKHRASGVTETAIKVSAGATAHVKIAKVTNVNDAIRKLKEMNVFVFASDMKGGEFYKTNLSGDIALVIGNEGHGVHELTKKICDGIVSIPQFGNVNSLNASVATGIISYEIIRQRGLKK